MKKGAIFDMDGLMLDTEKVYQETWRELAASRGITLGETFTREICGTSGATMAAILCRHYHTEDGCALIGEAMDLFSRKLEKNVPVKPGIREILEFFKENNVRTAVASSSQEARIRENLKRTGLDKYIDKVVSGFSIKNGKPAPDIFLTAAEAIGLPAEECYVFEDAYNGVRAGRAAGAYTIMIPDLIPPDEEMREKADAIYGSLLEALEKMTGGE